MIGYRLPSYVITSRLSVSIRLPQPVTGFSKIVHYEHILDIEPIFGLDLGIFSPLKKLLWFF